MGNSDSKPVELVNPQYRGDNWEDTFLYFNRACERNPQWRSWVEANVPMDLFDPDNSGPTMPWTKVELGRETCSNWARQQAIENFGPEPTGESDCLTMCLTFVLKAIENFISSDPVQMPETPSMLCWVAGGTVMVAAAIIFLICVMLLNQFFGFSLGNLIGGFFKGAGFLGNWVSDSIKSIAGYIGQASGYVLFGAKYLLDIALKITDWIVYETFANPWLVYLNLGTLIAWAFLNLGIDFMNAKLEWEGTIFEKVFRVLDWPFEMIMKGVSVVTKGEGLMYYVVKLFLLPWEGAGVILSFVVGGVLFVFKELIKVLVEDDVPHTTINPITEEQEQI